MSRSWYSFTGNGSPFLASNYFKANVRPGCINGTAICAIYANGSDVNPVAPLTKNLNTYISNALVSGIAQPLDSGNAKKYVYLKS